VGAWRSYIATDGTLACMPQAKHVSYLRGASKECHAFKCQCQMFQYLLCASEGHSQPAEKIVDSEST
jgi:hypothetical protein